MAASLATPAIAQTKQAPGVTANEILLGQTMPYSGPASSYAPIGRVELAYLDMINDNGGINGRRLKLLSLDDGYSPPKTVEQTRKLVEEEGVACIFQQLGTPCATATRKYLNSRKVPQIFVASGATQFGDPQNYPWTIGWQVSYQIEGRVYAHFILETKPDARIAVLFQNDNSGRDFLKGFKDGLGDRIGQLVATSSYEPTDPTVDSQVVQLRSSGADALFMGGIPKFNAMTLRKVRDLGWDPLYVIATVGASVSSGLAPAGLDKAIGLVTGAVHEGPVRPAVEERSRLPGLAGLHAAIHAGGRPDRYQQRLWILCRTDRNTGLQAMRSGPVAGEHHAPGGQPGHHAANVPDRHPIPNHGDGLSGHQTVAATALQRPSLGAVRRSDRGVDQCGCSCRHSRPRSRRLL